MQGFIFLPFYYTNIEGEIHLKIKKVGLSHSQIVI